MSTKKSNPPIVLSPGQPWWVFALGLLGVLFALFEIYGPALNGPFLFDDLYLPFLVPGFAARPLTDWLSGVRPALMFTFWANTRAFGLDPYWFHAVNLILHAASAVFVWLIAARLLPGRIWALFCTVVFLFHPLQTESVAYVASRSEILAGLFFLAGWTAFLYRRTPAISLVDSLLVLLCYGLAVLSKEHTVTLGAVLLLSDYYFNPGFTLEGIRRNWKLYTAMLVAGIGPALFLLRTLQTADSSAGFRMRDLTWSDYLFTQFGVLWTYVRLFLLPFGQNVDYDLPISHSPAENLSWLFLLLWIAALALAWIYRRTWPYASFGLLLFLLILAPTSSILPIRDVLVERRMYMPVFALAFAATDLLRRLKTTPASRAVALTVLTAALAAATWQRAAVWSSAQALWADASAKSPAKARPRFQLAYALYEQGRCADAMREYAAAGQLMPADYRLHVDWALAADCAGQSTIALTHLEDAARLESTAHVHALIGMVRAKAERYPEALAALAEAEKLDPQFPMTFVYRGNVHLATGQFTEAIAAFSHALELDPTLTAASTGLANARRAQSQSQAQPDANRR